MPQSRRPLRIGLIADTHGLLRPEALERLRGCDQLIHAGDIGKPEILAELERLAPLSVVRGNNDTQDWAADIPERLLLKIGRLTLYVLHDLKRLDLDPAAEGIDVVVAGHSHKPLKEERDGVSASTRAAPGRGASACRSGSACWKWRGRRSRRS